VVAMAREVDVVGPRTLPAVDRVVHEGRLPQLLDALAELPATSAAAAQVWERIATAEVIGRVVATEPVDFKVLDRLVPRVGSSAAAPLLDALAAAESRGTRRGLLAQLARMGGGIGPIVVARLEDPRWYVTRNMLGLLDELPALPGLTSAGRTLFGRARFPPKSPEVVVALQALATGWRGDPRAAARLTQAAASSDPEICAAARTARALR